MKILLLASCLLWATTIVDSYRFAAVGGAPAGNSWTIAAYTSDQASNVSSPTGNTGDILVVWVKWEGAATLDSLTGASSGAGTLRGTAINHGNGDLHCRFATIITTVTTTEIISPTWTGTPSFIDWAVWRVRATGTIDYSISSGGTGTGTSVSSGSFTTATINGLVLAGLGPYGAMTASSQQVGGLAASNTRTIPSSASVAWDRLHTAQVVSGAATATMSPSIEWVCSALALSAQ